MLLILLFICATVLAMSSRRLRLMEARAAELESAVPARSAARRVREMAARGSGWRWRTISSGRCRRSWFSAHWRILGLSRRWRAPASVRVFGEGWLWLFSVVISVGACARRGADAEDPGAFIMRSSLASAKENTAVRRGTAGVRRGPRWAHGVQAHMRCRGGAPENAVGWAWKARMPLGGAEGRRAAPAVPTP